MKNFGLLSAILQSIETNFLMAGFRENYRGLGRVKRRTVRPDKRDLPRGFTGAKLARKAAAGRVGVIHGRYK